MSIWNLQVQERVKVFIWLLNHDRIMTNYRNSLCGIGDAACQLYGDACETKTHVLRDCPIMKKTWDKLVPNSFHNDFYAGNL